jgi:hypothetical protein
MARLKSAGVAPQLCGGIEHGGKVGMGVEF